jgi:predicted transglutaminase-like cysteine proteinase
MKVIAVLMLVLGMAGCASVGQVDAIPMATAMTDGPLVPAPAGWVDYCRRHAEDPSCRS